MQIVSALAVACVAAAPLVAGAQEDRYPPRTSAVQTFIEGLVAGAGLGVAYVNPYGEGWLVSDETALPAAALTGLTAAFVTRVLSARQHPAEKRRPRFSASLGRSSTTSLDYALGVRVPVASRFDAHVALLTASDSWDSVATETRCGMLGCFTADYVVDERHEQSVSATVGGVFTPGVRSRFHPTVALGAGPIATNVETFENGRSRKTGIVADAMLGVEYGSRSRWTAEVGARMVRGTAAEGTSVQVRVGRAFGY